MDPRKTKRELLDLEAAMKEDQEALQMMDQRERAIKEREDALRELQEREAALKQREDALQELRQREEALKQREDALRQLREREEALKQREDAALLELRRREAAVKQREDELRGWGATTATRETGRAVPEFVPQQISFSPPPCTSSFGQNSGYEKISEERESMESEDDYNYASDRTGMEEEDYTSADGSDEEFDEETMYDNTSGGDDFETDAPTSPDGEESEELEEEFQKPLTAAQRRWRRAYFLIRKHLTITKHGMRTTVGTGAEMEGFALGFVPAKHPVRMKVFALLYHQYPHPAVGQTSFHSRTCSSFLGLGRTYSPSPLIRRRTEYCLAFLICAHLIILVMKAQVEDIGMKPNRSALDLADAVVTFLYTVEMLLRILCLGFVRGEHTFLKNSYNKLDFVIVFDSWIHLLVKLITKKDTFARIAVFRAFRVLPILRSFSFFGNLLAILEASRRCIAPLNNVILLTFFILSFYGLVGVQTFGGSLSRRCVNFYPLSNTTFQEQFPEKSCGIGKGYQCPNQQACEFLENPNWGAMNFDSFPYAILTMFQVITFAGWSTIMYSVEDAETPASAVYFITLCVFGSYFLVSVFVAAISGVFLRVRREHQILIKRHRQVAQSSLHSSKVMEKVYKAVGYDASERPSWQGQLHRKSIKVVKTAHRRTLKMFQSFSKVMLGLRKPSLADNFPTSLPLGPFSINYTMTERIKALVLSPTFIYGAQIMITMNLCILCLYHEGMSDQFHDLLYVLEAIMLLAFIVEMCLRFMAVGFKEFIDDGMNVFDVVVIVLSCVSLATRLYPNISAIRALRWFYRPGKSDVTNRSIMTDCIRSLGALSSLVFFYCLIIFIYAIISMELWGGEFYDFDDGYPRQNYDTIFRAMLSWFIITTAESWPWTMGNAMRPGVRNKWTAPVLFVFYFGFTVYVILNLIIAIILEKSEMTDRQKKHIQKTELLKAMRKKHAHSSYTNRRGSWFVDAMSTAHASVKGLARTINSSMRVSQIYIPGRLSMLVYRGRKGRAETRSPGSGNGLVGESSQASMPASSLNEHTHHVHGLPHHANLRRRSTQRGYQLLHQTGFRGSLGREGSVRPTALESSVLALMEEQESGYQPEPSEPMQDVAWPGDERSRTRASFRLADFEEFEGTSARTKAPWYITDSALFLFRSENKFRVVCQRLMDSKWYRRFIFLMVFVSIVATVETSPQGKPVVAPIVIDSANKAVLVVFGLDIVCKSISYGFLLTPDAYLGDAYNFLDLFNFIVDLLATLPGWSQYWLRVLRMLVAFRPTRLIVRISGLRDLVTSLLFTIPAIASTLAFSLTIFAIFATIGLQLFRGRFNACNDDSVSNRLECVGVFENSSGVLAPRLWETPTYHFDDIGNAMLSLYVCSTFDNWVSYFLNTAMDIPSDPNDQPTRNHSYLNALFFVAFVFIGGHFVVRMFVGVFVDQFGIVSGSKLLTERQKLWRDNNRIIQRLSPTRMPTKPRGKLRSVCFRIAHSVGFGRLIVLLVVANFVCLASQSFHANITPKVSALEHRFILVDAAFVFVFSLELAIKLLGSKFHDWCVNFWNFYEAIIVIGSAFCIFPARGTTRLKVGRVFFLVRIFRIIRYIPPLHALVQTVFVSLPSMVYIISLLLIILFEFAGVGVQMFSHVRDGACIGPHMNFRTFVNAFVVVFQVATADNWSCIMNDCRVQYPSCAKSSNLTQDECGLPTGALVYFIFLVASTTWICTNLFVAEILDTITFGLLNEEAMITPSHLLDFQTLWAHSEFDPKRKGFIGLHKLRTFLNCLGLPLGRRPNAPAKWYTRIEYEVMSFHQRGKGVPFKQLLETLTLYKIGAQGLELALRIEREKQIQHVYRHGAATKIQAAIRGFIVRARLKKWKESNVEIDPASLDAGQKLDPDSEFTFRIKNMLDLKREIFMLKTLWF